MRRPCALAVLSSYLLTACVGPAEMAPSPGLRVRRALLASVEGATPVEEEAGPVPEEARLGEVMPGQQAAEEARAKAEMFPILTSKRSNSRRTLPSSRPWKR